MENTQVLTRPRKGNGRLKKSSKSFSGYIQTSNEEFYPSRSHKTAKVTRKSPEGKIIEINVISKNYICRMELFPYGYLLLPRFWEENYNSYLYKEVKVPNKFLGRRLVIPEPLPLPDEWRKLLPKVVKIENFFFDFDDEWVHTHFRELYESQQREGRVYIEPSNDRSKVFFIGTDDYACHYFLELNK